MCMCVCMYVCVCVCFFQGLQGFLNKYNQTVGRQVSYYILLSTETQTNFFIHCDKVSLFNFRQP